MIIISFIIGVFAGLGFAVLAGRYETLKHL